MSNQATRRGWKLRLADSNGPAAPMQIRASASHQNRSAVPMRRDNRRASEMAPIPWPFPGTGGADPPPRRAA